MGKSTDAALGGTVYTEASETVNNQSEKENEDVKGNHQLHPLCPGHPRHRRFWNNDELVARVAVTEFSDRYVVFRCIHDFFCSDSFHSHSDNHSRIALEHYNGFMTAADLSWDRRCIGTNPLLS
jgi:hypothetical protein